jgi:hypothetical protein
MDRNSPEYYVETTEESLIETEKFLEKVFLDFGIRGSQLTSGGSFILQLFNSRANQRYTVRLFVDDIYAQIFFTIPVWRTLV